MLTPTTPFALNTVVERALARGIPVVILGAPVEIRPAANLSVVRPDLDASARLAAQRIRSLVPDVFDCCRKIRSKSQVGDVQQRAEDLKQQYT